KLQTAAALDLTPSMHWPTPATAEDLQPRQGPVLVLVEYRVQRGGRDTFVAAMQAVAAERRRDGAYAWGLYEDAAAPGRLVETFLVESWIEHLRQHERVTKADSALQERAYRHLQQAPVVVHFIDASTPAQAVDA
ncbi:MAG: MFS transporter, partial [Bryobacteraceae bacterium]